MEGVTDMNKFKHYGKDVWVQTFTETNWVEELREMDHSDTPEIDELELE